MNEEMADILKQKIFKPLLSQYRKCQVYLRFIDDFNVLQITARREMTPCCQWSYCRVYMNPLIEAASNPDYASEVIWDFAQHFNRWIKLQFS